MKVALCCDRTRRPSVHPQKGSVLARNLHLVTCHSHPHCLDWNARAVECQIKATIGRTELRKFSPQLVGGVK